MLKWGSLVLYLELMIGGGLCDVVYVGGCYRCVKTKIPLLYL